MSIPFSHQIDEFLKLKLENNYTGKTDDYFETHQTRQNIYTMNKSEGTFMFIFIIILKELENHCIQLLDRH
jgi:hypothetical protein